MDASRETVGCTTARHGGLPPAGDIRRVRVHLPNGSTRLMHRSRTRRLHSILAGFTAITVVAGVPVHNASARAPASSLALLAVDEVPTTVLGLEGKDEAAATALTGGLRKQFAARGMGGGQEMSLVELSLTMGCETPPSPQCLAGGGQTLNVQKLVYGSLAGDAVAGYTLKVNVVDVATGGVEKTAEVKLTGADIQANAIDATSTRIVNQVLGPPADKPEETGPGPVGPEGPEGQPPDTGPDDPPPPKKSGKLIWGKDPNPPKWKKTGLWASVGVAGVSLGAAIGMTWASGDNGPIRQELLDAAAASPNDDNPDNDISPDSENICQEARQEPPGEPGKVTNAELTKICNKGDGVAVGATVSWVVFGAALLSTAAFATLLFVRKNDSQTAAKLYKRGVSLGVAPDPQSRGVMFSGGFRF